MITIINIVIIIRWVFSFSLLSSNFYWRDNEHCNDMGQNVHVRGQNKKNSSTKLPKVEIIMMAKIIILIIMIFRIYPKSWCHFSCYLISFAKIMHWHRISNCSALESNCRDAELPCCCCTPPPPPATLSSCDNLIWFSLKF